MIKLLSLTQYNDNLLAARWLDDEFGLHFEFNALHDADGRPIAVNREGRAPRLTAAQLANAEPFQEPAAPLHPAYDLAAKGTAVRPDWANRYQKAAEIAEANGVTLTSDVAAVVVSTSGTIYAICNKSCTCKFSRLGRGICSHYLAVRMARALGQPIGGDEATRERAAEARRQANRDAKERRIANRGENIHERNRRRARRDGDGARQYWRMAYANGTMAVSPEIARRAGQGGD